MPDLLYKAARLVGTPFRYRVYGLENIIPDRPRLFISNHAGSLGPLSIYITLPVRLHPWVIAEMVDIPRTADYLYKDFVLPAWHLDGHIGRRVSNLLAPIAVGVINSCNPVSVDRNRGWCRDAFHQSLELLLSGESLLIFPEHPDRDSEKAHEIRPFLGGFCWLSQMYRESTGEPLTIQPMAVYPPKRRMMLDAPIILDLSGDHRAAIDRSNDRLQDIVHELYNKLKTMA
jgi:1-acyl-sn-glycerol-3-phosphate acyltransferase